jgi:thiamine-monophosphate kinase
MPRPRLQLGQALAPLVSAMMDVSDGLLLDAARIAEASGVALAIDLAAVPLSNAFLTALGDVREARLAATIAGDDYELLFAAAPERTAALLALSEKQGMPLTPVGTFVAGAGLTLFERGCPVPLPARLGWEHG